MTVRRTRLRVNSTTSNWYPATSRRWCTSSRRTLRTPGWWLATTRVSSRRPRVPARPARPSRCRSASPACPNRSPRESPSRAPVSVSRCPPRVDAARGAWTRGSAGPACRARVWDVAHRPWRRLRRGGQRGGRVGGQRGERSRADPTKIGHKWTILIRRVGDAPMGDESGDVLPIAPGRGRAGDDEPFLWVTIPSARLRELCRRPRWIGLPNRQLFGNAE